MFDIEVPRNCKAVVSGRIEDRTRFSIGRHVPIYFVDFRPEFRDVPVKARCKEGIEHTLVATVRLAFPSENLARVTEDQGHSDRSGTLTLTVENWLKNKPVIKAVEAAAGRYIREAGFADLAEPDKVFRELGQAIQAACSDAKLVVQLVSSEITRKIPSEDELAEVEASGFTQVARHFREVREQIPKLQADLVIAKLDEDKRIKKAEADLVIAKKNEEDRIAQAEADLAEKARTRDEDAKKRNGQILELAARLQFEYDKKRIQEEKDKAILEKELDDFKKAAEEEAREKRKLEAQIDLEIEKARAKIRSEEKGAVLVEAAKLLASFASIQAPDLSQVRTFVTTGNSTAESPRDLASSLMSALLSSALDLSGPKDDQRSAVTGASVSIR
jgi:hypothetical protein